MLLCGRTPSGECVAVSLDATGALCVSGSGNSGTTNTLDVYENGQCEPITIVGRNVSTGLLGYVPLDESGNLSLN